MKMLYLDTETTGLNAETDELISISGIIENTGRIEEFDFMMCPQCVEDIKPEILGITGLTKEEIKTFEGPAIVYYKLIKLFDRHINKFDRSDKFTVVGYNVRFDVSFLHAFFKQNKNDYLFSYLGDQLDVYEMTKIYRFVSTREGSTSLIKSLKLSDICEHFSIKFDAHKSIEDIRATRKLFETLIGKMYA